MPSQIKGFILVVALIIVALGLLVGGIVALWRHHWVWGIIMLLVFGAMVYGGYWFLLVSRIKNLH